MKFFKGQPRIVQLQVLVWIAVFFIIYFSIVPEDGFVQSAFYTVITIAFYLAVIYGNIKFLYPRFYLTGHKVQYVIYAAILVVGGGFLRGYLIISIYNAIVTTEQEKMSIGNLLNFVVAMFLIYLLSFIYRIAIAYFALKQQSEQMLVQKSQAELNLLKSQVQPHFLFNTLNNIYYEAYREAPRTAKLIERLSDIMRYFVDESPRDEVSMATEINFLENYIALEKIRIRHPIDLVFTQDCNIELRIPPMLLMTFVENIFKHGIDKSSSENKIELSLILQDGYLVFQTKNRIHESPGAEEPNGFGIHNLSKRLILLYNDKFELIINDTGQFFTAYLKVPIA
jgi:sensor histidine kinase YesM